MNKKYKTYIGNMKVRIAIIATAIFLFVISCTPVRQSYTHPEGPRYMGQFAGETPEFDGQFKVVTYNIKLGKNLEQAIRELDKEEMLRDADVIFLQEMDPDGVYEMAQRLQYDYIYYPAALHPSHDKGFGNAVLSKWPIKEHQKVVLPHEHPIRKMHRIAVFALLAAGELEILTCSVHTELYIIGHENKMDQVEEVVQNIGDSFDYVIIGGDFNTDTDYSVLGTERIFRKAGFKRANKGLGYTSRADPIGILKWDFDHIYVRGFEVLDAGKYEEAEASDHLPVWTVLKLLE
jgi:endonuclease/exonuclease/phosphatase family metal-dependent hydrolase